MFRGKFGPRGSAGWLRPIARAVDWRLTDMNDDWRTLVQQPASLPGQRLLFEDEPLGRVEYVDSTGQRYLFGLGHDLQTCDEPTQTFLWDV